MVKSTVPRRLIFNKNLGQFWKLCESREKLEAATIRKTFLKSNWRSLDGMSFICIQLKCNFAKYLQYLCNCEPFDKLANIFQVQLEYARSHIHERERGIEKTLGKIYDI